MLATEVRIKLLVFVLLTVTSLSYVYLTYMRGLDRAGIGVYDVTMEMPVAGGLYENAQVSYRGVAVGIVVGLDVEQSKVVARLRLDGDSVVPADLDAYVRSTSAVGEQYVDLVPRVGSSTDDVLVDGSVIEAARVDLPVSTATLLANGEALLGSLSARDVTVVVDELAAAFAGTADEMELFLDSSIAFQQKATENLSPTMRLLSDLQVVLATQDRSAPDIAAALRDLRGLTGTLVEKDPDLRALLAEGSPFLEQLDREVSRVRPHLSPLLNDTRTIASVLAVYDDNLEHILTVLPALVAGTQSVVPRDRLDDRQPYARLAFKVSTNDSLACVEGFPENRRQRSPHDLSPAEPPTDAYCKVPHDDRRVVRGARNAPCPNSSERAATAELCGLVFPRYRSAGSQRGPTRIVYIDPTGDRARTEDGEFVPLATLANTFQPDDLTGLMLAGARG